MRRGQLQPRNRFNFSILFDQIGGEFKHSYLELFSSSLENTERNVNDFLEFQIETTLNDALKCPCSPDIIGRYEFS